MSVLSGTDGVVDGVNTVQKWSINSTADLQAYVASNTKQGTVRVAGNKDWTGTFEAYGHTPIHFPGDSFTATLSIDETNGVVAAAICDEVVIEWDIEAGAIIKYTTSFSANADLVFGAAAATDVTVPVVFSSIGTKLESAEPIAVPVFTEIINIRTMTLTITRSNQAYVSSGTAGSTRRVKGNLDYTFSYTLYEADPTLLIAANAVKHLKVFVNATLFWELKWVRFGEVSNLEVDIEGATLVGPTQSAGMEGFTDVAGTATEGYIKDPATTTLWPV